MDDQHQLDELGVVSDPMTAPSTGGDDSPFAWSLSSPEFSLPPVPSPFEQEVAPSQAPAISPFEPFGEEAPFDTFSSVPLAPLPSFAADAAFPSLDEVEVPEDASLASSAPVSLDDVSALVQDVEPPVSGGASASFLDVSGLEELVFSAQRAVDVASLPLFVVDGRSSGAAASFVPSASSFSFSEASTGLGVAADLPEYVSDAPVEDIYARVLDELLESENLGLDASAKGRLRDMRHQYPLAQMCVRDLVAKRVVDRIQLARAMARGQRRRELISFGDVPYEATQIRQALDVRAVTLLKDARVIPLLHRQRADGVKELHLAHESPVRNITLESALSDLMGRHEFVWHFAMRDVCGAFWLAADDQNVDSSMEAEALLDTIISTAIDARSSDIHIDPSIKGEPKALVKYRVDGLVHSKEVITLEQLDRLRVRIENIARMPKVDLHHPNKGAFSRLGFDWRVQIQPHAGRQGPISRIVIRRLQPEVMPLEVLGYPEYFIKQIKAAASAPNGVVFWTGPTGSGKTEAIHAAVVSVNPMGKGLSVHTIEDPPEKRVPGYAVQMEIMETDPSRTGLQLLKSSLRADPDVIVFGEVRDGEMAKLVFEAANTGHLVFTTLHTNTSLDAVVRLDEMGVHGFMLSYVRGIAAQRLLRRLCVHCRIPVPVQEVDDFTRYVFDRYGVDMDGATLYRSSSEGCTSCHHTGYHGRIAIAEWLKPTKELVEVSAARDYGRLEEVARRSGWQPMGYMGVLHVKNGITDTQELVQKVLELSGETI